MELAVTQQAVALNETGGEGKDKHVTCTVPFDVFVSVLLLAGSLS